MAGNNIAIDSGLSPTGQDIDAEHASQKTIALTRKGLEALGLDGQVTPEELRNWARMSAEDLEAKFAKIQQLADQGDENAKNTLKQLSEFWEK